MYQLYWKLFLSLKTRGSCFPGRIFGGLTEIAYPRVHDGMSGFADASHDEQRPLHESISEVAVEAIFL